MADFETTTLEDDCRVWVWGLASLETPDKVEVGLTVQQFCWRISNHNSICYFHNLKFDSAFILDFIMKHGYVYVDDRNPGKGQFTTLISDMGRFYTFLVHWENGHKTEFRDSFNKIPMSAAAIAKAFKYEDGMTKGEIDYDAPRPLGYQPTAEEIDYLNRDVTIVARAMKEVIDSGMTRLTVASDAMNEFKKLSGSKLYTRLFPVFNTEMDAEIRRAYRGGFTYADPRYTGQVTRSGLVLDVNSLYPSVMKNRAMPYGEPEFVEGKVTPTADRPLTIFSITFTAKLKPNHIPCIQIKGSSMFAPTTYLTEIKHPTTLMMTDVDLALYQDHYDINIIEYGGGWRFKAALGIFDQYIDKWAAVKEREKGGKREIAKLHLNSLYGRFATNPRAGVKYPTLIDDVVKLVRGEDAMKEPVYTAVGVFITSYARDLTIRAAQASYGSFAYADTDSLHLLTYQVPEALDIHPTRMGAWKFEYAFEKAFYVRPKFYLERKRNGEYINRVAGLKESVSEVLTFDDLVDGRVLKGKLTPKRVSGGIVLKEIDFTLNIA